MTGNMEELRADPDKILKTIEEEQTRKMRGHLHLFFGYAAGVGKTFAMLKEAHKTVRNGCDTVVGYVEPHMRPATSALLRGLEVLPTKLCRNGNIILREFDIDAALKRKPKLILVDELAHTNAPGCRHEKRYQDVEELLAAGIDVYSTVNVQHIESLNDMVASITGIVVHERIPDKMFDDADQVRLVDIEPQELLERLKEGKIYREAQAKQATSHFFTVENLTALREIALRRCADRVNRLSEAARAKSGSDYYTDEHILVCISPSPTNQKIIRNAARMAKAFHGSFTALFVETPDFESYDEENKRRLRTNIHLAEQLGATVETTYGDDVALQIAEFARLSGVSKIVVGRSSANKRRFFRKPTLNEKLISYAPNLDVYVIPDQATIDYRERKKIIRETTALLPSDIVKSIAVLVAATGIGFIFYDHGFSEANIIMVYILGVLVTAIVTTRRLYSIVSSFLSVLVFNFFFTEPRYTLSTYDSSYIVTFLVMFLSAYLTGRLTVRIKQHAKQSAAAAYRTKILLDTNRLLLQSKSKQEIVETMANQLIKLLRRDIIFYLPEKSGLSAPITFPCEETTVPSACITENEKAVAAWVFKNNKHAGATTGTLSNSKCLYLAIRVIDRVYGVVGIAMRGEALDSFENNILLSILGEGALALESEQSAADRERVAVRTKYEQLRATTFRAISNDLRTPLTSISGNAGILIESSKEMTQEKRDLLYNNIYDDSLWVINLTKNLLTVTRLAEGSLHMKMTVELLDEVVDESLKHVGRQVREHNVTVHHSDEFLLVKIDARLIMQVIVSIMDNAIKYTQSGSNIDIRTFKQGKYAVVTISDNGPGISDGAKPHIFDMFYTSENVAESKKRLGLGLALCRSIISVHDGKISVSDNHPRGSIFTFKLLLAEVNLHE